MYRVVLFGFLLVAAGASAQVPVTAGPDQQIQLRSADAKLAANKKLVYDFWREVLEARHVELAEKYLTEGYIQHNPNVPTGRKAFVDFFSRLGAPQPIEPRIKRQVVAIVAEGDYVMLGFVQEVPDPRQAGRTYTTTWFDLFRIENGKIAEHWDSALKQ